MLIVLINCYQNVVTSYLLKKPRALNSKSTPQLNAGLQASTVVDNPQVLPSTYILYRMSWFNARFFRASLQRKRARRNILPRSYYTVTCGYYTCYYAGMYSKPIISLKYPQVHCSVIGLKYTYLVIYLFPR